MFSRRRWHRELSLSLPPSHLLVSLLECRLRLVQGVSHSLIWRRDWPPRTCLGDALQEPPPLRFPEDHLAIDATNDRVIDHRVIVVAPIARVPALNAGLGARFAEEEGHAPCKNRQGTESRGRIDAMVPAGDQRSSVPPAGVMR